MTIRSLWTGFKKTVTEVVSSITSVFRPSPEPPDLEPQDQYEPTPTIFPPTPPVSKEKRRWDAAYKAEERFATQLANTDPMDQFFVDQERSQAAGMGLPQAGLGHPSLLPPLELLTRYENLSEDQALKLIENAIKNNTLDQIMQALRTKHRNVYVANIQANTARPQPKPTLPIQPFVGLNGSAIRFEGDLNDALRFVFDKWISSPWSGTTSPPMVEVTTPDGQTFLIPTDTFRKGASQVIYYLNDQLNDQTTDWWVGKTSTVNVVGWKEEEYKLFQQAENLTDRIVTR